MVNNMMYLGVDIGGTAVKIGLVDENGCIQAKDHYSVNFDNYQTPIIETVIQSISLFLKDYQIDLSVIEKIGVSATGQIDTHQGQVIGVGGNINHWEGVHIKKRLNEVFLKPVTVVNDANCMIIGEQWIGVAKGKQNVVGITIGTGVGGGIIVNGDILLGTRGIAGELGHFSIDNHGITCSCGNRGCYERYAAMTALIKMVKLRYEELNLDVDINQIDGRIIFKYAQENHNGIQTIIDEWIDYIAIGLVSLTHIFNPEMIVLGGGVCQQEEYFLKPLRKKILDKVMPRFSENLEVVSADLGNDAGLVGAVYYAITHE